jgi:hypothetical protein
MNNNTRLVKLWTGWTAATGAGILLLFPISGFFAIIGWGIWMVFMFGMKPFYEPTYEGQMMLFSMMLSIGGGIGGGVSAAGIGVLHSNLLRRYLPSLSPWHILGGWIAAGALTGIALGLMVPEILKSFDNMSGAALFATRFSPYAVLPGILIGSSQACSLWQHSRYHRQWWIWFLAHAGGAGVSGGISYGLAHMSSNTTEALPWLDRLIVLTPFLYAGFTGLALIWLVANTDNKERHNVTAYPRPSAEGDHV